MRNPVAVFQQFYRSSPWSPHTLIFRLPYCHHISPYSYLGKRKGENFLVSRQSAQPGHDACSLPRWKACQPVWILVLGHRQSQQQTGEGKVQMFRHIGCYPGHCTSLPPKQKNIAQFWKAGELRSLVGNRFSERWPHA